MYLAILGLGAEEIVLVLLLLLVLFGPQALPRMARSVGRAKAEFDRASRQVTEAIKTEEEKQLEEQLAFERLREHQVAQQQADPERAALARAAEELGLQTAGLDAEALRLAIAAKVGAPAEPGLGKKDGENAANAQQ